MDLHCHILPGVDDGAVDMEMALLMIRNAVEQGIDHIILTPHFRFEENDMDVIKRRFSDLRDEVKKAELPVELYLGGEIYYDSDSLSKLLSGQALTMAGTRYVLIEFSPAVSYHYLNHAIDEFLMAGFYPILAHAERYQCISDSLSKVEELVDKGVYIQINANSFLTHPKRKQLIELMKDGLVHFVATDCHRTNWRPVNLKEACSRLAEKIDKDTYCRVFFKNPQLLLENEII